jgi:hypothetical protein
VSATTFARRTALPAAALAACTCACAHVTVGVAGAAAGNPGASVRRAHTVTGAGAPARSIRTDSVAQRPHAATSAPEASLTAAFEPERLGRRTTLSFGFRIADAGGRLPPALTAVTLNYPNDLGIALSGLGLATCTTARLEASGLAGCPADSIMGFGRATAEISLGSDVIAETVPITILRAPDEAGHIVLLFNAVGIIPLNTSAVFTGALLPAPAPFGGRVSIDAPLIASVPGAPDISIVALKVTLGPSGVIYYEQLAGRTLAYQPPGILLPDSCPHGGFPFAAEFSFADGSHASANTTDPCPAAAMPAPIRRTYVRRVGGE